LVPISRFDHRDSIGSGYFGFTEGLPPGVPGGGITGILSPDEGGICFIWGSTSAGGLMTPPELLPPVAGGSTGWVGCSAGRSAAMADAPRPANAATMSHVLRMLRLRVLPP
jgi:hypothetical protein